MPVLHVNWADGALRLWAESLSGYFAHRARTPAGGPHTPTTGEAAASSHPFAASAEECARRANAELAGRVQVNVFGSSQLGGDEVKLQKLKLGTLDFELPPEIGRAHG